MGVSLAVEAFMTLPTLCFSADTVKLSKYQNNFLKSSVRIDAIQAGELSGDQRLFMALLDSNLLNSNIIPAQPYPKVFQTTERR